MDDNLFLVVAVIAFIIIGFFVNATDLIDHIIKGRRDRRNSSQSKPGR